MYHMDNADINLMGMDHHVLGLGVTWLGELLSQVRCAVSARSA